MEIVILLIINIYYIHVHLQHGCMRSIGTQKTIMALSCYGFLLLLIKYIERGMRLKNAVL